MRLNSIQSMDPAPSEICMGGFVLNNIMSNTVHQVKRRVRL